MSQTTSQNSSPSFTLMSTLMKILVRNCLNRTGDNTHTIFWFNLTHKHRSLDLLHKSDLERSLGLRGEGRSLWGRGFGNEVSPQDITGLTGDVIATNLEFNVSGDLFYIVSQL